MPHGWLLSADFQLYLCSFPIILLILKGFKKTFFFSIGLLITSGLIWQFIFLLSGSTKDSLVRVYGLDIVEVMDHVQPLHFATRNYFSVYFMGTIVGYLFINDLRVDRKSFAIRKKFFIFIPLFSLSCLLSLCANKSSISGIILGSLFKPIQSSIILFIYYASWCDPKSILSNIGSNTYIIILSRISYSTFMIHYFVIWYFMFNQNRQLESSYYDWILNCIPILIISQVAGLFVYLFVEAPFFSLIKFLFSNKVQSPKVIEVDGEEVSCNFVSAKSRQESTEKNREGIESQTFAVIQKTIHVLEKSISRSSIS